MMQMLEKQSSGESSPIKLIDPGATSPQKDNKKKKKEKKKKKMKKKLEVKKAATTWDIERQKRFNNIRSKLKKQYPDEQPELGTASKATEVKGAQGMYVS